MEIDDLLPEKPLSTLFFHGIFWKSKTSNTVDFPKAFPENLAWGNLHAEYVFHVFHGIRRVPTSKKACIP